MADIDTLREAPLFVGLSEGQLQRIASQGAIRGFNDGEKIFEEGAPGEEIFILLNGRVQITVEMSRKTEQAPVHTVLPGKVFGEFALVSPVGRSATAQALRDGSCFVFSRAVFHKLAEKDPQLGYVVMRNLGEILVGRIVKTTRELRASLMF